VKSWITAAPCRSMTISTLPVAGRHLTPRLRRRVRFRRSTVVPARAGSDGDEQRREGRMAFRRLLLLGERHCFLPLEPEFLHGEYDLAGPICVTFKRPMMSPVFTR